MKNQHSKIIIIIVVLLSIASITFSHYVPSVSLGVRNAFSSVIVPIQKGINNVGMISYVNQDKKKNHYSNESFQNYNNNKPKGHSVDLDRIKNLSYSFYNNNIINQKDNNEKEKISLGLSSEQLVNNINNSTINENLNIKQKKRK